MDEGLSPRVRGNLRPKAVGYGPGRSIPACAGEPVPRPVGVCRPRVYPRVCGGTVDEGMGAYCAKGLSPRVRGNPPASATGHQLLRSIPACAGEPRAARWLARYARVYPRVCGGTQYRRVARDGAVGLSPRVRGNPFRARGHHVRRRSIPACAGEPQTGQRETRCGGVYPRVCGGTSSAPPRPSRIPRRCRRAGSIPACAGEPIIELRPSRL